MEHTLRRVYCGPSCIISSLGISTAENYKNVNSYMTNISEFADGTPVAFIDKARLDFSGLDELTFAEKLSVIALQDIVRQSNIELTNEKTLLIISTTKGNIDLINSNFERSQLWSISNLLEDYFDCANKPLIISNACISGVAATIIGARLIEKNKYDHIFVLGVDVVSEFIVSGFNSFKSISPSICKPYDATRDGLTLGEGCATILLTSDKKLSENSIIISGGGVSDDANHISGPSRTGDGLEYAISSALNDAGLETSDISMMNLHGTGTLFNDEMESKAVNNLALTDVPCNSLKPYLGHTLGASGVIEIILTIEELKNNHIFGVKGYQNNGVPFELNINAHHRNSELKHCLKTASGFGGTNAAIIISKESVSVDKEKVQRHIDIEEITGITIEKSDTVFPEYIRHEYKALGETNMKFFKMDNLSKLGYIASCKLMSGISLNIPLNRIGIVMATRDSSLDTDLAHHEQLNKHLPEGTSPAIFVYTLANIVAAEIAIKQHFKGELMMFVSEHKNMNFLKEYSEQLIADNRCDAVLYGWCNFLKEEYCAELKLITTK